MRPLCDTALQAASEAGADYADVRVVDSRWQAVRTLDGGLAAVDRGHALGMGVRARVGGAWGFASAADLSRSSARFLAQRAVHLAESSRLLLDAPSALAPAPPIEAEWHTPVAIEPFTVPISQQVDLLLATEAALRGAPAVTAMAGRIACSRQITWLATSEGTFVVQSRVVTGAGYRAFAETPEGRAVRSWPQGGGGQLGLGGWERVDELDLIGSAIPVSDDVTRLIHAARCPNDVRDVVLTGPLAARLVYETLGRAFESDRFEAATGGGGWGTFVDPSELGRRELTAPSVSLADDPTLAGGFGTYGFDDEGVAARRRMLVERGRWVGALGDREAAGLAAGESTSGIAAGSARADGFAHAPLVRLGNLELSGGVDSLDRDDPTDLGDLIDGVEEGLLLDSPLRVVTDESGRRLVCRAEMGWTLRHGRRWEPVRTPTLVADAVSLWGACDAVAASDGRIWAIDSARRGVPEQTVGIGVAAPPVRFRQQAVGPPGAS